MKYQDFCYIVEGKKIMYTNPLMICLYLALSTLGLLTQWAGMAIIRII